MSNNADKDWKGEFQERVKADGAWAQFVRLREQQTGSPPPDSEQPDQPQADGMPSFDTMSAKGNVSFLDAVRWVSERLGFPESEIDWTTAPGATAVSLMQWVKRTPVNEDEFWLKYGAQLLPPRVSQRDSESESARQESILTNNEVCDRFLTMMARMTDSDEPCHSA